MYFLSKTGRMNIIEFNTFESFKAPSFILIGQFCLFNLVPKNFRLPLIAKNELGTRLRQFYFFFAKFAQKVYSRSKTGQMNITIVFNISELVDVTSFILNRQFWFWNQICPKRVFSVQSRTNEHHRIQISNKSHL